MKKLLRPLLYILGVIVALILASRFLSQPAPAHVWFDQFDRYPLVIAHADTAGTSPWPGDTMLFLENVAAMGVDVLEMNVNMTGDGHIVLNHDITVDETTDGTGIISEMTLAEVQALDAAYDWTQDDGGTYPYRGQGIVIPTLEEVFQTFPDFAMIVEIKQEAPSMAQPLCDLIREYGMEEKVIVPSFSDMAMSEFRAACPEVATAASTGEVKQFVYLSFAFLSNPATPPYFAMQVPIKSSGITVITPGFVANAHRRGLQIHAWTINKPEDMQMLKDMGVDGIMTDRPDVLLEMLGR
ncbi:MAG TPA: glycerophosphodiester phosphodiesterase [Anaerolineales bacterium]|nr:glycerophosphodiester phosphodiesterase [Anaerolineales bacterium]